MTTRDDSRERAEEIMATLNLLLRVHPVGHSVDQVEAIDRFLDGINKAKANICEYILLRKAAK